MPFFHVTMTLQTENGMTSLFFLQNTENIDKWSQEKHKMHVSRTQNTYLIQRPVQLLTTREKRFSGVLHIRGH